MNSPQSSYSRRVIEPPLNELSNLRTPLNPAEEIVLAFFDQHLPPAWEIYIQPHLNGMEPDFVLLNPKVGVAVYEVKGWSLDAYWVGTGESGAAVLMGQDKGQTTASRRENPIDKIHYYKQELSEIYCARVGDASAYRVITAGVIFPFADDEQLIMFEQFRQRYKMTVYPDYYPLVGRQALETNNIQAVFPDFKRTSSRYMNEAAAQDLRGWLVEPDHAKTQRARLELNNKQKELATTRTATGYRRIKGPAGSGKSLVLDARAAEVAREGKQVLIVSFNITLLDYLRDLAVRWPMPGQCPLNQIAFLNFHTWCKRVCLETGHLNEYRALFGENGPEENLDRQSLLNDKLPALIAGLLDADVEQKAIYYDAVLVDEGQDFKQVWWNLLRKICRPNGEMLLVADTTQDIYERTRDWTEGAWTDQTMEGTGFRGPWTTLTITYRLPAELTRLVNSFAQSYLPAEKNILPEEEILPLIPDYSSYPVQLRWVQTDSQSAAAVCFDEIINLMVTATPQSTGISDITFLVPDTRFGRELVKQLAERKYQILNTFNEDERQRRRQKHAFFMGDARIKGTTIHSFKGWETRALLVYTSAQAQATTKALLYTAMTRLKRHPQGSFLTVVSALSSLSDFGRKWPVYEEVYCGHQAFEL